MVWKTGKKRRFRPFSCIVSWWKRRKFYFLQQDILDEASCDRHQKSHDESIPFLRKYPPTTYFAYPLHSRYPSLTRNRTIDSFQVSIESMDSLVESCWDLDEEASQVTAFTCPVSLQNRFLQEHLNFLSYRTQPREVEVLFNSL